MYFIICCKYLTQSGVQLSRIKSAKDNRLFVFYREMTNSKVCWKFSSDKYLIEWHNKMVIGKTSIKMSIWEITDRIRRMTNNAMS